MIHLLYMYMRYARIFAYMFILKIYQMI